MESVFSYGCGCGCGLVTLDTKGAAIAFALIMSTSRCEKSSRVNYAKAQKIFDFICSNVKLPDVRPNQAECAEALVKTLAETISMQKEVSPT